MERPSLRVIMLVDPEIPVPPVLYGGIERIVDFLTRELTKRGHAVTLLAHPDSDVPCELVPWRGEHSQSGADTLRNAAQVASVVFRYRNDPLVVHSFARLAYLTPLLPLPISKIQSYQREITPRSVRLGRVLSNNSLAFTACSAKCGASSGDSSVCRTIYNGVPIERFEASPVVAADAPLVFLGRVERIKGPHHAIEVARRTGRRLVIAGNLPASGPDVDFAQRIVAQCDGSQIVYAGPVDDAQKNELLKSSACFLMPIEWEEPFGIVMAEALACGSPVLGFRRGSVPEVVEHGTTGFVCDTVDDMVHAVGKLETIDRMRCRQAAETRFSDTVITSQYEELYYEMQQAPWAGATKARLR